MSAPPNRPADLGALQRRTLAVVMASQVLGGAGLAAGLTVGALLAQDLLGRDDLAGLPVALLTFGAALSALLVGRTAQRLGRRAGLTAGFAVAALGSAGVVLAADREIVWLFFVSLFLCGAGTATNLQARYAGTDLAEPGARGRAVSVALVATTLGAVAGPNLIEPLGRLALQLGVPALAGPFVLGTVAYAGAATVLFLALRPDPLLLARELDAAPGPEPTDEDVAPSSIPAPPRGSLGRLGALGAGAGLGGTVMVLTMVAMVAVMTMTPVHMRAHDHTLGEVGLVIGVHIGAMYLPSPLTGLLVDRIGRVAVAVGAAITLALAGLVAALAPADSLGLLIVALALLGLGWNLGLISGSALVIDGTTPADRARTQGTIDVLVSLGGAGGALGSGVVFGAAGYAALALIAGAVALVLTVPVASRRRLQRAAILDG